MVGEEFLLLTFEKKVEIRLLKYETQFYCLDLNLLLLLDTILVYEFSALIPSLSTSFLPWYHPCLRVFCLDTILVYELSAVYDRSISSSPRPLCLSKFYYRMILTYMLWAISFLLTTSTFKLIYINWQQIICTLYLKWEFVSDYTSPYLHIGETEKQKQINNAILKERTTEMDWEKLRQWCWYIEMDRQLMYQQIYIMNV